MSAPRRLLVLAEGRSGDPHYGKTGRGVIRYRPDDVLLFGRESLGVPLEVHEAADARLFIPLTAGARSLNLVTAAAMAVSEALRQTDGFPKPAP